jgi:pSer/pThr/pTyr-binding forkhead associated (FHA) protein
VPQEDESMIVRSCDGNLAAFYVMKEKSLKIGRSSVNTIRSLEVSVENEHAEIFRIKKKYFLRDNGTEAGTFIKIIHPKILSEHTLVEMGSFLIEAIKVDKESKMLTLGITHMVSKGTCELIIGLQDGCSFYSFGRRKSNNFCFDDEHLSGMHARIFILHGEFVI